MKRNYILNRKLRDLLLTQCKSMHYGEVKKLDIHTSMVIENGEDIIGYQYLHGTNADVGGFVVKGTAYRSFDGTITCSIECVWNDIIDPNYKYDSDSIKAQFATLIPFAHPTDYYIRITWCDTVYFYTRSTRCPYRATNVVCTK